MWFLNKKKLGRGAGGGASTNVKLKEDVEFLKANLSALW